ncbi:MAG TPA: flagellar basal-body rod protein FlgF [Rhizomicrobium sp.]|nr:flagellar basal-body rod protein FlgF [Rhizomicrobium sp.]
MDNSLLVSLSQQLAAYRSMDVIANNLANVSTAGYKRDTAKFEEYVQQVIPSEGQTGMQSISFVRDAGTDRDLSQGTIQDTGATYDLALNGKGYFTVQTPQGIRYTRDGHFTLNADGQIVTEQGYALQGDGGSLTITPNDSNVQVSKDGTISSTVNGTSNPIGKLQIVDFANDYNLTKEGANLYTTDQAPAVTTETAIRQGALESSNVQPVLEISHMLEVMRAYQATATLTQSQEDLSRKAINQLGQMPS